MRSEVKPGRVKRYPGAQVPGFSHVEDLLPVDNGNAFKGQGQSHALEFVGQQGQVIPDDVETAEVAACKKVEHLLSNGLEQRAVINVGVRDAVNSRCLCRYRDTRPDSHVHLAALAGRVELDGAYLDNAIIGRVQAGCFEVKEHNRFRDEEFSIFAVHGCLLDLERLLPVGQRHLEVLTGRFDQEVLIALF